ncbi:hypothetical protein F5141DRAFT_1068951 [Pisolithus sp. B1]|nr:hypothetical protein F5141DRAFT_1068951 [Pisolithus sp. B1]
MTMGPLKILLEVKQMLFTLLMPGKAGMKAEVEQSTSLQSKHHMRAGQAAPQIVLQMAAKMSLGCMSRVNSICLTSSRILRGPMVIGVYYMDDTMACMHWYLMRFHEKLTLMSEKDDPLSCGKGLRLSGQNLMFSIV